LTGPNGALPYCYTELLLERAQEGDHTMAAFLDLFHHRLASLFFRAWEKHRPALALERAWDQRPDRRDDSADELGEFTDHLFALIGLGLRPLRGRHSFADDSLLYYVGLFAQRHRSAVALEAMIREFFGLPIEVVQFVEQWLALDPRDHSTLSSAGGKNRLGVDLIMGARVRDVASKFRLRIGPTSRSVFRDLAPDGPLFRRLVQFTRLFVDAPLSFDVQLILSAHEVPEFRLKSGAVSGSQLGRDAWVRSGKMNRDVEDAVFEAGP
jgi:type VI secretion system protein ImpH